MGQNSESENRTPAETEPEVATPAEIIDEPVADLTAAPESTAPAILAVTPAPTRKLDITGMVTFVVKDPTGAMLEGHVAQAALELPKGASVLSSGRLGLAAYKFEVMMPYHPDDLT